MSDLNSPEDALAKLRTLVREGNFEFAPRKKSHVTSKLARIIVDTLSIDHYNSMGFDYDGTGDLVFVFISDDEFAIILNLNLLIVIQPSNLFRFMKRNFKEIYHVKNKKRL